jgi:lipopolysaccharide export system permease protein
VDPGNAEFGHSSYGEYTVKLEDKLVAQEDTEYEDQSTAQLLKDGSVAAKVELQWRLSLMIMVPIVVLMAVPLSKVNPRQGRYLKMLPAILLYLAYLSLMMAAKGAIEKGKVPEEVGLFWVHGVFLCVGLLLNYWPQMQLRRSKRRMDKLEVAAS